MTKLTKQDRATLAAMIRLVDQEGAEVAINRRAWEARDAWDRFQAQQDTWQAACDWHAERDGTTARCLLAGGSAGAGDASTEPHHMVEPWWAEALTGDAWGRMTVVVPAPTPRDMALREYGHGQWTRELARGLRTRGVNMSRVSWVPLVWCTARDKKDYRRATAQELDDFWPHVERAIDACDSGHLILHGDAAKAIWRADLSMDQVAGGAFLWRNKWIVHPIRHVASVGTRGSGDTREVTEAQWNAELDACVEGLGGWQLQWVLGELCVGCLAEGRKRYLYAYDGDGVGWCKDHPGVGLKKFEAARKKDRGRGRHRGQGVLI